MHHWWNICKFSIIKNIFCQYSNSRTSNQVIAPALGEWIRDIESSSIIFHCRSPRVYWGEQSRHSLFCLKLVNTNRWLLAIQFWCISTQSSIYWCFVCCSSTMILMHLLSITLCKIIFWLASIDAIFGCDILAHFHSALSASCRSKLAWCASCQFQPSRCAMCYASYQFDPDWFTLFSVLVLSLLTFNLRGHTSPALVPSVCDTQQTCVMSINGCMSCLSKVIRL